MTIFQQLSVGQLSNAAEFISDLNSKKEHHIGYCGTEYNDLYIDLHEDFIIDGQTSVFAAFQQEKIIALVGFDMDDETAEVWGPFSVELSIDIQTELWHFATGKFPRLENFSFFINEENKFQHSFMNNIGAKKSGEHLYLNLARETFHPAENLLSKPYNAADFEQFEIIHHNAFSNTYYSAQTIAQKLHAPQNQLIILRDDENMKGYAYYEVNEILKSAHIEYLAVAPEFRGQGLGELLLNEVLTVIFTHKCINQVTLTVNNTNNEANRLYYKTGFSKVDALWSYLLYE